MKKVLFPGFSWFFGLTTIFGILILHVSSARTAVINVPGNYSDIKTAINAANNGDVIIVDPNTYNENIDFLGKSITVRSTDPYDPSVVASTIIDGSGKGSVITFQNGEGNSSELSGFTIQNGKSDDLGGGINCINSSPTISYCTIRNNQLSDQTGIGGAGISCTENSLPNIQNCTIRNNETSKIGSSHGAGIYCNNSSPTIIYCTISNNLAHDFGQGGGIFCTDSSATPVRIINCIINNNKAELYGGGIKCESSSFTIANSLIVKNSVINQNAKGGGIHSSSSSQITITNCTISDNTAEEDGGGIFCDDSSFTLINCILWNNSPNEISSVNNSTLDVIYSCIQGGYTGTGNKADSPLFINPVGGDYHLSANSPCIDSAHPNICEMDDLDNIQRPQDGDNNGSLICDMGAYEFLSSDPNANGCKTYYRDADNDNYGDPNNSQYACQQPAGYVTDSNDCDDNDSERYPGNTEVCDGKDNDCNGIIDDPNELTYETYYRDKDNDNFGDPNDSKYDCRQPAGYINDSNDCDDNDPERYPGNIEACDGKDNDCDGLVPSAEITDIDGDNVVACNDCDDNDSERYPGNTEVCDGKDNDCNGVIDDPNELIYVTYYRDADIDNYGDPNNSQYACQQPAGYVLDSNDCDDSDEDRYPGNTEVCDGKDNDCDGSVPSAETTDSDGDSIVACNDCDDNDPERYPGNTEVCNGKDNDCNGVIDDPNELIYETYYHDKDNDNFGDPNNSQYACQKPAEYVLDSNDCDDSDEDRYPGNTEVCDGKDNDCNGIVPSDEMDADADGFRICEGDCDDTDPNTNPSAKEICDGKDNDCDQTIPQDEQDGDGDGVSECGGDCDPNDNTVYPGASEFCDGKDNDCNGVIDDPNKIEYKTYYRDADNDTYGDPNNSQYDCLPPLGYVLDSNDCDDADLTINSAATEVCDGIDNDCDGVIDDPNQLTYATYYLDADNDTYGDPDNSQYACQQPAGYILDSSDCDDTDPNINPGKVEIYDGIDNDCQGGPDDHCYFETDLVVSGLWGNLAEVTFGLSNTANIKINPNNWSMDDIVRLQLIDANDVAGDPNSFPYLTEDIRFAEGQTKIAWYVLVEIDSLIDPNLENYYPVLSWDPDSLGCMEVNGDEYVYQLIRGLDDSRAVIVENMGDSHFYQTCARDGDPIQYFMILWTKKPEPLKVNLSIEPNTMKIISFVHLPDDANSINVFGDVVRDNYHYKKLFKIGTYNPIGSNYIEYGKELIIELGKAYWCYAKNGLDISFNGLPVSLDEDFKVKLQYDSNSGDGWNMFACPYNVNYEWNNVEVWGCYPNDPNNPKTIKELVKLVNAYDSNDPRAPKCIDNLLLWKWKNGTYVYYDPDPNSNYKSDKYEETFDPNMKPNEGYWVKVLKENIYLKFPHLYARGVKRSNTETLEPIILSDEEESLSVSRNTIPVYSDSPPAPPGGFGSNREALSNSGNGGCFINTMTFGLSKHNHFKDVKLRIKR